MIKRLNFVIGLVLVLSSMFLFPLSTNLLGAVIGYSGVFSIRSILFLILFCSGLLLVVSSKESPQIYTGTNANFSRPTAFKRFSRKLMVPLAAASLYTGAGAYVAKKGTDFVNDSGAIDVVQAAQTANALYDLYGNSGESAGFAEGELKNTARQAGNSITDTARNFSGGWLRKLVTKTIPEKARSLEKESPISSAALDGLAKAGELAAGVNSAATTVARKSFGKSGEGMTYDMYNSAQYANNRKKLDDTERSLLAEYVLLSGKISDYNHSGAIVKQVKRLINGGQTLEDLVDRRASVNSSLQVIRDYKSPTKNSDLKDVNVYLGDKDLVYKEIVGNARNIPAEPINSTAAAAYGGLLGLSYWGLKAAGRKAKKEIKRLPIYAMKKAGETIHGIALSPGEFRRGLRQGYGSTGSDHEKYGARAKAGLVYGYESAKLRKKYSDKR
ncbi:MAG: hypothetical protein WCI72_03050 [archaeon]